jgi:hypothetical protein
MATPDILEFHQLELSWGKEKGAAANGLPPLSNVPLRPWAALSMAVIMPMMRPVMVMLSYFYNHLRRSWNNRSRKHKKRRNSHQQ